MEHVLRPEVQGFDYPTVAEHFSTVKQKQYTILDRSVMQDHVRGLKNRDEITRSLRRYEINHQDSFKEAIERSMIVGGKMREYLDARSYRESLNRDKGGKALVVDEVTIDRKGKKKLVPIHLAKYLQRKQELKDMEVKVKKSKEMTP